MAERDEEWGPWIEHCGTCWPVKDGEFVHGVEADGDEWKAYSCYEGPIGPDDVCVWLWSDCYAKGKPEWRLLRYRIRKPRALRDLIKLAETVPSEMEDA